LAPDPAPPRRPPPSPTPSPSPDGLDPTPAAGDLAALYDAYGGPVYRLALRLCGTAPEAEDLCHDVFVRFWRQDRYDPRRGPVLAYLLLLTRSMALNRLRQRSNRQGLLRRWSAQLFGPPQRSPHDLAEQGELAERVRSALAAIPAAQRQVLEMAYYEGLSQSAIGERLQLPLGTVKSRSRQGLIRLRQLLIDLRSTP